jgi:Na+/H+ antiporter NhaC
MAKLDTGMIIIIIVVAMIYIRVLMLRGKHRREERQAALEKIKAIEAQKGKSHRNQFPDQTSKKDVPEFYRPQFQVTSWWIIGPAVLLMLVGMTMRSTSFLPAEINAYYWTAVAAGGILFLFGLK